MMKLQLRGSEEARTLCKLNSDVSELIMLIHLTVDACRKLLQNYNFCLVNYI